MACHVPGNTLHVIAWQAPGSPLASSSVRQGLPCAEPLTYVPGAVDHDPSCLSIMTTILRGIPHAGALAIMTWGYLELENTITDSWIRSQTVSFGYLTSGTGLIVSASSGRSLPVLNNSRVLCYSLSSSEQPHNRIPDSHWHGLRPSSALRQTSSHP
jgi:hypothetical protein